MEARRDASVEDDRRAQEVMPQPTPSPLPPTDYHSYTTITPFLPHLHPATPPTPPGDAPSENARRKTRCLPVPYPQPSLFQSLPLDVPLEQQQQQQRQQQPQQQQLLLLQHQQEATQL
mmetsp:Transcript_17768/g.60363  ORF Transcript_17768/g.60363 Transcript_17768/m.60363 type:complete len:118 (-) Transcript_17768:58-411(-)